MPDCPFLYTNSKLVVFFYVDDFAVLYHPNNQSVYQEFRTKFLKAFKMRELGELKWFLGIRVVRDRKARKLWLCQDSYITKISKRFRRTNSAIRLSKTLIAIPPPLPYTRTATNNEIQLYSQVVGSLTYPASITRPDIAFCTKYLAQNLKNPGPRHIEAAYRYINYLEDTKFLALEYGGDVILKPVFSASTNKYQKSHDQGSPPVFLTASDTTFTNNELTRKSLEGYILKLFNSLFN